MRIFYLFIAFLSACVILSCKENQVVETLSVRSTGATASSLGGVVLTGSLSGFQSVQEHGFILSRDRVFSVSHSLGRPKASGSFSYELDAGLEPGRYVYRAYVTTGTKYIYGDSLSFTYIKNKAPEIQQVQPAIGHLGDTLTITGKNFSTLLQVMIGTQLVYGFSKDGLQIKLVIPDKVSSGISTITLIQDGITYPPGALFELYQPEITGISPATGAIRSIVDITGNHFDIQDARNSVKFGTVPALVVFSSRTKIKVVVPDNLTAAANPVTVYAQNNQVTSTDQFVVKSPVINSIPAKAFTYDVISIEGSGFHPIAAKNMVYFGETVAEVMSGTATTLQVRVPRGPYPKREMNIRVSVLGQSATSATTFTVDDPWLMVTNTLPFGYYRGIGSFSMGSKAYVIAPAFISYPDRSNYLWTMNNDDFTWSKQSIPFNTQESTGVCRSNGTKVYFYTGDASHNFWELDPGNNTWTAMPDFIGGRRDKPVMFAIGEDIYVGWGSDFTSYPTIDYNDFYRYRPSTQSWVKISEPLPIVFSGRTDASSFTLNGAGYIGCGAQTSGQTDFWKYDPGSDVWSRVADFGPKDYTSSFELNGKGYIANGSSAECWEYNPSTNTWRRIDDIGIATRSGSFAFVLNGTPYVGGGDAFGYDPNHPSDLEMFALDVSRMK